MRRLSGVVIERAERGEGPAGLILSESLTERRSCLSCITPALVIYLIHVARRSPAVLQLPLLGLQGFRAGPTSRAHENEFCGGAADSLHRRKPCTKAAHAHKALWAIFAVTSSRKQPLENKSHAFTSTHARRPPMTPPGMASRGPPPESSMHTCPRSTVQEIARLQTVNLGGLVLVLTRGRSNYQDASRRTRNELQAHHGHVTLLSSPHSLPAMVLICMCECECKCVISYTDHAPADDGYCCGRSTGSHEQPTDSGSSRDLQKWTSAGPCSAAHGPRIPREGEHHCKPPQR
jgi:hypothetical protein